MQYAKSEGLDQIRASAESDPIVRFSSIYPTAFIVSITEQRWPWSDFEKLQGDLDLRCQCMAFSPSSASLWKLTAWKYWNQPWVCFPLLWFVSIGSVCVCVCFFFFVAVFFFVFFFFLFFFFFCFFVFWVFFFFFCFKMSWIYVVSYSGV